MAQNGNFGFVSALRGGNPLPQECLAPDVLVSETVTTNLLTAECRKHHTVELAQSIK